MQYPESSDNSKAAVKASSKSGYSAVGKAYSEIKKAIFTNEFAPGDRITEAMLTQRLGISRTPVREAFRRLGAEGWLELMPDQGVKVSEWTYDDIDEIFEIRAILEPYVARRAAALISASDIQLLRTYTEQMQAANQLPHADMIKQMTDANSAFHNLLIKAAGNSRLLRILSVMMEIQVAKRTFKSYSVAQSQRSIAHHYEIITALEARDGEWAAAAMRSHILAGKRAIICHRPDDNETDSLTLTAKGITS